MGRPPTWNPAQTFPPGPSPGSRPSPGPPRMASRRAGAGRPTQAPWRARWSSELPRHTPAQTAQLRRTRASRGRPRRGVRYAPGTKPTACTRQRGEIRGRVHVPRQLHMALVGPFGKVRRGCRGLTAADLREVAALPAPHADRVRGRLQLPRECDGGRARRRRRTRLPHPHAGACVDRVAIEARQPRAAQAALPRLIGSLRVSGDRVSIAAHDARGRDVLPRGRQLLSQDERTVLGEDRVREQDGTVDGPHREDGARRNHAIKARRQEQ